MLINLWQNFWWVSQKCHQSKLIDGESFFSQWQLLHLEKAEMKIFQWLLQALLFLCPLWLKVSSRVKKSPFSKFAIFRRLNRAHQELCFKKNFRKKCFFCADLWSAKVFAMLIALIDRWQVLSYLIRVPLLNQANHAIWQKSWFKSIASAHCFSLEFEGECLQKRKKSLSVFVLDSKTKEDKVVLLPKSGLRN